MPAKGKKKKMSDAEMVTDFIDVALKDAEHDFGTEKCYVGAEHEARQLVLEIPHISLRWLIESNGWPLSRYTQSGGAFGSSKSAFAMQLEAWFLEAGGIVCHVDTENKTSPSLMKSILPAKFYDTSCPDHRRLQFRVATSINEWQQMLTQQYKILENLVEKAGRKPNFPILWVVDSLRGSHGQEALDHLNDKGEAVGRGYSDAPLLLSNFFGTFVGKLIGWPITLHTTNHEKVKMGTVGVNRPGGAAPDYYATFDIKFKKGGQSALSKGDKIKRANLEGKNVTLIARKSSMGSDIEKKITVPFLWKFERNEATGLNEQVSWWDWESTTSTVLKAHSTALRDIMDIDCERKAASGSCVGGEHYWSHTLGVNRDDALSAAEFGKLVEAHELRPAIEDALHIQRHPTMDTFGVSS